MHRKDEVFMNKEKQEIREAIEAGNQALRSLREAREHLSGAKGWGIWDMLGGGFLSTMLKHSKMEDAQSSMQQANQDLERFRRELQDVDVPAGIRIEVGNFLTFADFFFDGIIADVMVQSKINDAAEQVEDAICHVEDILKTLREVEQEL